MKLLTFMHNGQEQVGVLSQNGQGVIPLKEMGYSFAGMNELIERATKQELADIAKQAVQKDEKAVCLKEVGKMAAIPRPRQDVLCLGINYMDHAEESRAL